MPKINWKDVAVTMLIGALGAIIFVPLIAPILVPWLKKIPVVGKNY